MIVNLKNICTFVKLTQLRRNPILNIFYKKESLASSAATKVPLPVLDCVSRTDGATLYTNIFLMLTEKQFVDNSQCAASTSAQQTQELDFTEEFNKLIIEYVSNRIKYKCKSLDKILHPICPKYLTIHDCSTLKLTM